MADSPVLRKGGRGAYIQHRCDWTHRLPYIPLTGHNEWLYNTMSGLSIDNREDFIVRDEKSELGQRCK
jgi:hypothetical protein